MKPKKQEQPAINPVHINGTPSLEEQSEAQAQPAINKVDESEEPLTDKDKPGWKRKG
jgi:hypothetical protein